jgi:RND superfamily putative drug exporter
MFTRLGRLVTRAPLPLVVGWIVIGVLAHATAPDWTSVAQQGEFVFLPETVPSKTAERLYRDAFQAPDQSNGGVQQDPLGSNVVIVVQREDLPNGMTAADSRFIDRVLRPGLVAIAQTTQAGYAAGDASAYITAFVRAAVQEANQTPSPASNDDVEAIVRRLAAPPDPRDASDNDVRIVPPAERVVSTVWTFSEKGIGPLLVSKDRKSTLVVVQLRTEFLSRENGLLLERIEAFVNDVRLHRADYPAEQRIPANLDLAISGSATVGRDMLTAERQSTQNTELYAKVLVIILLIILYRAPLLVVIPLITVGLTTDLTVSLLRHMAAAGWIGVFSGLEIYVTVVVYGFGVDCCLFLIARYKEDLDAGATFDDAMSNAISRVGLALATSAGTSVAGIGMMMFAEFGKFPQAGFSISFGLCIVLICSLTLTPAMLRLAGRYAFWPDVRKERISAEEGWIPETSGWSLLIRDPQWTRRVWDWAAGLIARRPGLVFCVTVLAMLPFAANGIANYNHLSYGLLSELPPTRTSVVGANAVKRHFPAGMTGITTVLVRNDRFNFTSTEGLSIGEDLVAELTAKLEQQSDDLRLVDVRSLSDPLGTASTGDRRSIIERGIIRNRARREYVSTSGPLAGKVLRLDLVFDIDPFTPESIGRLAAAEEAVRRALSELASTGIEDPQLEAVYASLGDHTDVVTLGSTASIRDLKSVTDRDRVRIAVLVTIAVYLVLITLLGRPAISLYLIFTVVFSFLATLGVTHAVFWFRDPEHYTGVDWKAPIFVFTILVAMGEDYNVMLMTRIDEEQARHGPVRGVLVALTKTGSIISSCGVIMAGTFASLMTGTLMGIIQLGFALSFGVLLDTFVVRPILVPSYLVLLYQGRFGRLGRLLGNREVGHPSAAPDGSGVISQAVQQESRAAPHTRPAARVQDERPT